MTWGLYLKVDAQYSVVRYGRTHVAQGEDVTDLANYIYYWPAEHTSPPLSLNYYGFTTTFYSEFGATTGWNVGGFSGDWDIWSDLSITHYMIQDPLLYDGADHPTRIYNDDPHFGEPPPYSTSWTEYRPLAYALLDRYPSLLELANFCYDVYEEIPTNSGSSMLSFSDKDLNNDPDPIIYESDTPYWTASHTYRFNDLQMEEYTNLDSSQIVLAIRGTFPDASKTGLKNLTTDLASFAFAALPTLSLIQDMAYASETLAQIVERNPDARIFITGHSLGGAMAQMLGLASGYTAYGFNAPGSAFLYQKLRLLGALDPALALNSEGNPGGNYNFRTVGDIVSLAGSPIGQQYTLENPFPYISTFANSIYNWLNNHLISTVIAEMAATAAANGGVPRFDYGQIEPNPAIASLPSFGGIFSGLGSFSFTANAIANMIDPASGNAFVYTESGSSPLVTSVSFFNGAEGVSEFRVWSYQGGWSSPETVAPGTKLSFDGGVRTFMYQALSADGQVVALPDGFLFDLAYASEAQVTATVQPVDAAELLASNSVILAPVSDFTRILLANDTGPSQTDFITTDGAVTFSGAVADTYGAGVVSVEVFNSDTLLGTATVVDGNWTLTTTLTVGSYNALKAVITDTNGNQTTATNAQVVMIDGSISVVMISDTGVSSSDLISSIGDVTFAWGDGDPANFDIASAQFFTGATLIGTAVNVNDAWTLEATLAPGAYDAINIVTTDLAGNRTFIPSSYKIVIDDKAPTGHLVSVQLASDTGSDAHDYFTSNGSATISGIVTDSGGAGIGPVTVFSGTDLLGEATVANGTWSLATTLPAGQYSDIHAVISDRAGNSITTERGRFVWVDQTAPTVTITSAGGQTTSATQTISGTGEPGTTVKLLDGQTVIGSAIVADNGLWSTNVTLDGLGAHVLTARDTDVAGNAATSSSVTYTLIGAPSATFNAFGPSFVVNQLTSGNQTTDQATRLADGSFVNLYTSADIAGSGFVIRLAHFNADGTRAGNDLLVSTLPHNTDSAAARLLPDGKLFVAWVDVFNGKVLGRVYNGDLSTAASQFVISQVSSSDNSNGIINIDRTLSSGSGPVTVSWTTTAATGDAGGTSRAVHMRLMNEDGTPASSEITINTTTAGDQARPRAALLGNGNIIVSYMSDDGATTNTDQNIRAQIFTTTGVPVGSELLIGSITTGNQVRQFMTPLADGRTLVVWESSAVSSLGDVSGTGIVYRFLDSNGVQQDSDQLVNTFTTSNQRFPQAAQLPDGRIIFGWESFQNATSQGTVDFRARVMNTDGTWDGSEQVLMTRSFTPTNQNPSYQLRYVGNGLVYLGWNSPSAGGGSDDGSGNGVQGQLFTLTTSDDSAQYGTSSADSLTATGSARNWMHGGVGDDLLTGAGTANYLFGADGHDTLVGGPGFNMLDGGAGNDFLYGGAGNDSLYGGPGINALFGYGGNDVLSVGDDGNSLDGGDGDDTLTGGGGIDWLYGQAGADTLRAGAGTDALFGGDGNDSMSGEAGDDGLDGGLGDDTMSGGDGVDWLYGRGGNDTLSGDAGIDALFGEDGNDTLSGGADGDSLDGGFGDDVLDGGTGVDWLFGSFGNDTLNGGDDGDALFGQEGVDILHGGAGGDSLDGGADDDQIFGDDGVDWLFGQAGNDALDGGAGGDVLFGGDGIDTLKGGADGDSLDGGIGDDTLDGGAGVDVLWGDAGADTFLFSQVTDGNDVVRDFISGTDFIGIDHTGFGLAFTGALPTNMFETGNGLPESFAASGPVFYFDTTGHGLWFDATGGSSADVKIVAGFETGAPKATDFRVM